LKRLIAGSVGRGDLARAVDSLGGLRLARVRQRTTPERQWPESGKKTLNR
jgi:hypothetical protein